MTSDHSPVYALFQAQLHQQLHVGKHRKRGYIEIVIAELYAFDIPASSDSSNETRPFISFHAPFLYKSVSTGRASSLSLGKWDDPTVLRCASTVTSVDILATHSILLKVRDAVVTGVGKDLIASGCLSLHDSLSEHPKVFIIPLSRSGMKAGYLQGVISIQNTTVQV